MFLQTEWRADVNRIFFSFKSLVLVLLGAAAAGSLGAQTLLQVNPAAVTLSAQAGSTTPVTTMVAVSSSGDATGNHLTFYAFPVYIVSQSTHSHRW